MKNLLILAMLTIFIFACKDEGAAGPQAEEFIEEIFFYNYYVGDGRICDSIFIYKNSSKVKYRRNCDDLPLFDTTFIFSDISDSFIDTFSLENPTIYYKATSDSIKKYLDLEKFFELDDTLKINVASISNGISGSKIRIITNLREKQIHFIGDQFFYGNFYIRDFYSLLWDYSIYHYHRLKNIHGRSY